MATSTPARVFDAAAYPRTYVPSLFNRVVFISFGGLLVGGASFLILYLGVAGDQLGPKGPAVIVSLGLVLALLGIYLIVNMLTSRVILGPDAIEVRSFLTRQRMLRQEITGRRFFLASGTIELIPRNSDKKKLKVAYLTNADDQFSAWFESLPEG